MTLQRVLDFLHYAMTHKAAVAAAVTLLTIVLAHFGIVIPHLPHEVVTAIGVVLTGFFGVTTDEAAFIGGFLEGHDAASGQTDLKPGGTA